MERHARNELQRLMTRLADGDRAAFHPLFALAWPEVRAAAARLVDATDADDAAQAALLKLFERASEFDPARDALAWLVGIVGYECLTLRKRRARRREHAGADEALAAVADARRTPEEDAMASELEAAALTVLGTLAPSDRQTLRAALFDDGERAAAPATFRKRLERALVRLRAAWRDHGIG